jgi:ketosteroid isomerase-like protein
MPRTMAFCHPEVEWTAPEGGTTYRGREGVRQRLEEWLESFDDFRYEVQRVVDCGGDEVLVVATEVGRGAMSGAEVRSTNYELLTIRDGMIVRIREYYRSPPPSSRRAVGIGRAPVSWTRRPGSQCPCSGQGLPDTALQPVKDSGPKRPHATNTAMAR